MNFSAVVLDKLSRTSEQPAAKLQAARDMLSAEMNSLSDADQSGPEGNAYKLAISVIDNAIAQRNAR